MLEPYAWKQARTVLRELGGSNAARLPGYPFGAGSIFRRKTLIK